MYLFGQEEIDAVVRVLASRQLFRYTSMTPEAVAFERELAARLGTRYGLLLSSGTAGLICALAGLGVGPGDEVIIPAYAFVADAQAVLAVGGLPVICEIDDSLTMDPNDLERKITSRTRAIMPVHMNGFPCDMDAVLTISRRHDLVVVEDACQAFGGRWRGQLLGTLGDVGVFSFNQFKILTAGEGGALVTNARATYERAFIMHDGSCGLSPHRLMQPIFAGLAFRASEITAAILRVQLRRLDNILLALRNTRDRITRALRSTRLPLTIAPTHDPAGSCGTSVACRCETAETANQFCHTARESGLAAFRGNQFLHSYPEWSFLFAQSGGHHPARNPLSSRTYDRHACPETARILAETVFLPCDPGLCDSAIERFREALEGPVLSNPR